MEEFLKLERLKLPFSSNAEAENFFQQASEETGATVQWEFGSKPSFGKDKKGKDPYIKISGSEESVKKAKDLLIDKMELLNNQVAMKMDITHGEHPSLIGKAGKLINKVMEATNCHIHFPDSNLTSSKDEKSNQVSIYGEPSNVESARVMLRALIPVQMYFEVPTTCWLYPHLAQYSFSPSESILLLNYNDVCVFIARLSNSFIAIIRCSQDQFPNNRRIIAKLIAAFCGTTLPNLPPLELPPVQMTTSIAHYHHFYIKGDNDSNVEGIMKRTGATIIFPDVNSRLERNTVKIIGNLDSVYMAWQEIMTYLPVSITFDINRTRETKSGFLDSLEACGITLFVQPKEKYSIKTVTVKGCERYSKQMLQYRQHLLRLPAIHFNSDIVCSNSASKFLSSLIPYFQSSLSNSIPSSVSNFVSGATISQEDVNFKLIDNTDLLINIPNMTDHFLQTYTSKHQIRHQVLSLAPPVELIRHSGFSDDIIQGQSSSPNQVSENLKLHDSHNLLFEDNGLTDYYRKKAEAAKAMRRPIESMETTQVPTNIWAGCGFSQSMPAFAIKDNLEPANNFSYFHYNTDGSTSSSQGSERWENVMKDCQDGSIWSSESETAFSHSNYFDVLKNMNLSDSETKDILPELLWQHGLHKYIDLFAREEINYKTFLLLTVEDLEYLGISFFPRKKLVCLIRELNDKETKSKPFDAAPGAERKH